MAGESFVKGEQKVRPGVYVRTQSAPGGDAPATPRGIVGAIIRGTWGPLATVTEVVSEADALSKFTGGTVELLRQAFRGGARRVKVVRAGTGGTKASKVLSATATAKLTITAKYEGTRSFAVTKRVSAIDATQNEVIFYEGTTLLETIRYTPGADDSAALVAAINAESQYFTATFTAAGAVDVVSQSAFTAGTDPTVDGAAYSAALGKFDTEAINVLAVDTEDTSIHASVAAWLDTAIASGQRVMAVLAEPSSVAFATRKTNSAAFNRGPLVYVSNGFKDGVTTINGYPAGGRVAGEIAGGEITASLTHKVINGATDVVGPLTNIEVEQAIAAGQVVFTKNTVGQVQIEYGITTLVTPGDLDAGYKKIRRVRTRFELINRIVLRTDPLIGRVNNDGSGQAILRSQMQGAINEMISEGALRSGNAYLDPGNASIGDSAYFVIEVDDNDSAEKVYLTFGFRFAPPAAA